MTTIPSHILSVLRQLIAEGLPIDQIAFMTRLSPDVVEAERARVITTSAPDPSKKKASPKGGVPSQ
jgi:hypothetical protein